MIDQDCRALHAELNRRGLDADWSGRGGLEIARGDTEVWASVERDGFDLICRRTDAPPLGEWRPTVREAADVVCGWLHCTASR